MMELNTTTLVQQLQSAITSWEGFVHFVVDAYSLPGFDLAFVVMLLFLIGFALYNKTQNIATTMAGITLMYMIIAPHVPGLEQYFLPVGGLLALATAWILWRSLTGGSA